VGLAEAVELEIDVGVTDPDLEQGAADAADDSERCASGEFA
jgi:hypothetical protein